MTVEEPEYYELFGIHDDATDKQILDGFRRAAIYWDPIRNKAPNAERMMAWVNLAHETLMDPVARADYNRARGSRKTSPSPPRASAPPPPPPARPIRKPVIKVDQTRIAVQAVQGQPIRASFVVHHVSGDLPPKWSLVLEKDGEVLSDARAVFLMEPLNRFPTTITLELPAQPTGLFEGSLELYIKEEA